MAYTTIDKPSDYFDSVLYTGNTSTGTTISSLDFAPNMVWFKSRTQAENHQIYDSVRGVTKRIIPNGTQAEATASTGLTNFDSNGFRTGGENETDSGNIVAWNWKAGTSFTNDASATGIGTIDSAGSVSDASGFSIVSYTGTGSAGTIKHGLSAAPNFMIVKNRDAARSWNVYFGDPTDYIYLNDNAAAADYNEIWNDTAPTTSVFSVGTDNGVNQSGEKYIAYIFADVQGYSKFGSYTGNGNANGTFVYTGFKPAWVMVKNTVNNARNWTIIDNKRNPFNPEDEWLYANASDSTYDASEFPTDFTAQGFKIRNTGSYFNTSGENYIYMAFAENPFVSSTGVPATAR